MWDKNLTVGCGEIFISLSYFLNLQTLEFVGKKLKNGEKKGTEEASCG
jgi:hypothetical protein